MSDDQRKSGVNWKEEFANLDPQFKDDIDKFSEIHCYFLINGIGGFISTTNRNMSHPERFPGHYTLEQRLALDKEIYGLRIKMAYVVLQLPRFGVEDPTNGEESNYEPSDNYWRWFNWWHQYAQTDLTEGEYRILEEKINNGDDVSEYRPSGDWRNPRGVGDGGKNERLKKLGIGE
jgi:hypothetical protein